MVLGPGDIGEIVKGAGEIARFVNDRVSKVEQGNLLKQWADLMQESERKGLTDIEKDKNAEAIRQFLAERLQLRGYTPWYTWTSWQAIPKDMLTDCVDLLVGGKRQSRGIVGAILSAMGFSGAKDCTKMLRTWSDAVHSGQRKLILDMLDECLVDAGRTRNYDYDAPAVPVDIDMICDLGSYIIQG